MKKRILIGICILLGSVLIFEGFYYISTNTKKDTVTEGTSNQSTKTDTSNDTTSDTTSDEEYISDLEDNLDTAISTLDKIESTEATLGSTVE